MRPHHLLLILVPISACRPLGTYHDRTVIVASGADLQSINPLLTVHPLARQVQRYVLLTTLARYDSLLAAQPYLASAWSWSADHLLLTLHLHTDLRWHDGTSTTSADVLWTLNAARDPATGYPRITDLAGFRNISAPDDSTILIQFAAPQPRFPDVLTDLAMLPAHLFKNASRSNLRRDAWNENPIGNGPFRFVKHESNRRWVFEANPAFPTSLGGPPKLERLVIAVVDEPTTKLAALTSGELDMAGIQPAHASFVRGDQRLRVIDYPLLFTQALIFNTRRAPFNDALVRSAAAIALDRGALVNGFAYGFGTAAAGPVPPPISTDLPADPYRPDSARQLLKNRHVEFELLTVGSGEAALEQLVQSQMAAGGFDVVIRQLELSAFLDRIYGPRHDFDAAMLGVPGDLSLGYLVPLLGITGIRTQPNQAPLSVFRESTPATFLYHARGIQGVNRRIRGIRMDLRGELVTVAEWSVDAR